MCMHLIKGGKNMKNRNLLSLLLIPLLLVGCNKKQTENKPTEMVVNDFESIEQLRLMKFPSPYHGNRGRMELSEEHVTRGNKSLKYYNEYGTFIEVCHYFDHIVDSGIDVSDIKSIEIDIYNDSDFDTSGALYICANDDLTSILSFDFELMKKEMNHISFPLSKVAIEFNAENIRTTSLKLFTPNTDYDQNVFYTFYLDNWVAKMGSEYTEVDKQYNAIIANIKSKIENLPSATSIKESDREALQEIGDLIDSLPDIYRGAVPNISSYRTAVNGYNNYLVENQTINYDRNSFMDLDKFYGIAQLKPDNGVKLEVLYTHDDWEGNSDDGSTKVIFQGSTTNRLVYNGNVELAKFDTLFLTIHNSSQNLVRIWLSYANHVYFDIAPNKTKTTAIPANLIAGQAFWSVDHLNYSTGKAGALVPSSGVIYFGKSYVIGRSQETLLAQMNHAFNTMPELSALTNEDAYLKGLTSIDTARKLYEQIEDKSQISVDKLSKLSALEEKYEQDGYGMSCSVYDAAIHRFEFGEEFVGDPGIIDNDYGFVSVAHITENLPNGTNTAFEQGFTYSGDVAISNQFKGYVFYVYSPLSKQVNLTVRTSNWNNWASYYVEKQISSGWNKIEVPQLIVNDSTENKFAIMVHDSYPNGDLRGDWKFTSLFGVPRVIS